MFERPVHARWPDQGRFILAGIGTAIGLEAFSSFAGAVLGHGGGAFLIAYLIAVATAVFPVLALEFGVGLCYQASAPDGLRRLDRRLEWLGWWTTALAALAALAAVAQLAWAALYGFDALIALLGNRPLPWGTMPERAAAWFSQRLAEQPVTGPASAAAGLAPVGAVVVASAIAWLVVHRIMAPGLTGIGRWCLAAVPLAVGLLIAVGVAVLYQPGAVDGVAAFLVPRWPALGEVGTWLAAYRAAFTTHALGLGIYIAYASHLKRGADAAGSAVLVGLAGAGFSFLAGIVVSAAAGALAATRGVPLDAIAVDGPRALFALLPTVCSGLPLPAWGCALMGLMLAACWMLLCLSSVLGLVAAVSLAIADKWGWSWTWLNARICLCGFFASMLLASAAGPQLVDLLHSGLFPYGIAAAVAAQCLALARVSGGVNLQRHLNAYSVIGVGRGWRVLVVLVTPVALLGIIIERLGGLGSQPALWRAAEAGVGAGLLAVFAGVTLGLLPRAEDGLMPRWLAITWGLLAVLGLGLWLGLVATARSRADLAAVVAAADAAQPTIRERDAADDLLLLELGATSPDPAVVAAAWSLLGASPAGDRARGAISRRCERILGAELVRARPDQARLHLGHDLAAVLGPEPAAAAHARIAAHAGDRSAAAAGLVAAVARLREAGASVVAVDRVAAAWEGLRRDGTGPDGLTWAALETPPVADAVADAGDALRGKLVEQLRTPGPERRAVLLSLWSCLQRLDQADACPPSLVARYADAVRRDEVPLVGLFIAVLLSAILFGGTAVAYRRLARGVRTIDPGAETMEGVDAVDLDTEAVTVQRNTTGEETRVE